MAINRTLEDRCLKIQDLFLLLEATPNRIIKQSLINDFKINNRDLVKDLDFCFEVLAGKYKLGYTYQLTITLDEIDGINNMLISIEDFYKRMLQSFSKTDKDIILATKSTPKKCRLFIDRLVNRKFKLGYSNKENMITIYSPMLAKKYPEAHHEGEYYIQEKLDGNRCIAYFDYEAQEWRFQSRSGKLLNVEFDMSWAHPSFIFDGEIMTLGHAGTRDFNRTSGAINSKYVDKSALHYFIYDIVDETLTYKNRKAVLDSIEDTGKDCSILPVLDNITVYLNPEYNWKLDEWLDKIVDKGGEGLILRDPNGYYQCGKRSSNLLKYKKVQTMDLRIVDFNFGNGKYENAIGSFVCQTDDGSIKVNVSGMSDDIHYSDPSQWMGRIIEVAYFSISKSKSNNYKSLRFPRLKRVRDDKDTTSIY